MQALTIFVLCKNKLSTMFKSPNKEAKIIDISKAPFSNIHQKNDSILANCVKNLQDLDNMINAYLGNCDQF
jgi:hypothetical protein